jgi:hypothetical protein
MEEFHHHPLPGDAVGGSDLYGFVYRTPYQRQSRIPGRYSRVLSHGQDSLKNINRGPSTHATGLPARNLPRLMDHIRDSILTVSSGFFGYQQ